jgi:hypothetical protein
MARVTAAEVREIMDNCTLENHVVDTFIIGAHELVDLVYANNTTISQVLIKEIERWFTAHMIASTIERTTSDEKIGDAAATYTGKWGENLSSTPYGQMVLQLDVTKEMSNIGKQKASIYAVKQFEE